MISSIHLPLRPPFAGGAVSLDGLKAVNFVFGSNGTGKTTISRLIAAEAAVWPNEHLTWQNDQPLDTYVYNRDFIESHFADSSQVPGVFTLGRESVETERRIDALAAEIRTLDDGIGRARSQLEEALQEHSRLDTELTEAIWRERKSLGPAFNKAWQSAWGSKQKMRRRFDQVPAPLDGEELEQLPVLEREAEQVFDENRRESPLIKPPDFTTLLAIEEDALLETPIVGNADLPIGRLIERLGNGPWVRAGLPFAEQSDGACPFCQQPLPADYFEEIRAFFDEEYERRVDALRSLLDTYANEAERLEVDLYQIVDGYGLLLGPDRFNALIETFRRTAQENLRRIEGKLRVPSQIVQLEDTGRLAQEAIRHIDVANVRIRTDNQLIRERRRRIEPLRDRIWRHLAQRVREAYPGIFRDLDRIGKRIDGLTTAISQKEADRSERESERNRLASTLTNVSDTARHINGLLARFGFTGFQLDVSEDERHYQIVRRDGTPVEQTLSEGERHFLTFLYFHHLTSGAFDEARATRRRVLVIDDPITSMDADVLYAVSGLVRSLARRAREDDPLIDQLIVLTHNLAFHREITRIAGGEDNRAAYYVIRKTGDHSVIDRFNVNPVLGTYDSLWRILYDDANLATPIVAQNVARRIVENFFRLVGGTKLAEIPSLPELADEHTTVLVNTLLLWANSGSHNALDDDCYYNTTATVAHFREALEIVFRETGYGDHVEYMKRAVLV